MDIVSHSLLSPLIPSSDLNNNGMMGPIPKSLSQLTSLQTMFYYYYYYYYQLITLYPSLIVSLWCW